MTQHWAVPTFFFVSKNENWCMNNKVHFCFFLTLFSIFGSPIGAFFVFVINKQSNFFIFHQKMLIFYFSFCFFFSVQELNEGCQYEFTCSVKKNWGLKCKANVVYLFVFEAPYSNYKGFNICFF